MKSYSSAAKKFYNSKRWKRTRQAYFNSKFGQCELCGTGGTIIHHKTEIDDAILSNDTDDMLTSFDNLQCLCLECHNKIHFSKQMFDDRGDLIQVKA